MNKKIIALVLAICISLSLCASAFAATLYCYDCKAYTSQTQVKQSLNNGIDYPMYKSCSYNTKNCQLKITAYRYTWQCDKCKEDTYNDFVVETKTHTVSTCPGNK